MRRRTMLAASLAAAAAAPRPATAAFPERAILLLHGFAPGGPADAIARLLAAPLGDSLGQPVVVEPRPGAGGGIAAAALSRAAPDGHTIGLLTGAHAVTAAFGRQQPYDPVGGFEMISLAVTYPFVLAVRADHPVRELRPLLELAREAPGRLQFGSAGNGTTQHLAGELLNAMAGLQITHVPYRGDAASITAVLGGEIPLAVAAANVAAPHAAGGRLRLLAITAPARAARLPTVPTVAESALPGYAVVTWAGVAAPRGTPPVVVARLNAGIGHALAQPAVRSRLAEMVEGEVATGTPAAMRALLVAEITRWQALIRARGIAPE